MNIAVSDRRIPELDGLRGMAGIMVVLSHYFGEVQHGTSAMEFGWVGVDIFFVLSGYLIGKLILEKKDSTNFFTTFYMRRFLRIVPVYILTVIAILMLLAVCPPFWANTTQALPVWTYFTFLQVFPMAATGSVGVHWLSPTWTLAVEEHFYLLVPALIVFTPRRYLVSVLLGGLPLALILRFVVLEYGVLPPTSALVFLPFRADTLICGLLAGIAIRSKTIQWERYLIWLRITPVLALTSTLFVRIAGGEVLLKIFSPLLMGIGCAAFILCLVLGAPEAKRFRSPLLKLAGDNSYCLYLVHIAVLGLMHGVFLGALPDIHTLPQLIVTIASLPVTVLLAFLMTRYVEMPLMHLGRNWKWDGEAKEISMALQPAV